MSWPSLCTESETEPAKIAPDSRVCTPGVLVSSVALLRREARPDEQAILNALAGVLCRCTGCRTIFGAVKDAHLFGASDVAEWPAEALTARAVRLEQLGPQPGRQAKPIVLVEDNGPIHTSKRSLAALAARAHAAMRHANGGAGNRRGCRGLGGGAR